MINFRDLSIFLLIYIVFFLAIFYFSRQEEVSQSQDLSKEVKTEYLENFQIESYKVETKKEEIRFLFFGDLMLDRYVREIIRNQGIDHIFSLLNEEDFTKDFDYVFANLEGAVTNKGEHYPPELLYDFAFDPNDIAKLKDYNFNIFTVANNHLADQGRRGVNETYENLSELGYYYFGCQDGHFSSSQELLKFEKYQTVLDYNNCSVIITETKGRKIAWLSFSIVYQLIDENKILEAIELAQENSDFVIVSPHWGIEYQSLASQSQRNLAKKMVDAGANLIIGHHPHVIQDYIKYHDTYIFYSLGNFIFDQYFSPETQVGLAVAINLDEEGQVEKELYKIKTNMSKIVEIIKINN